MSIQTDVRDFLIADAAIAAIIGSRMYPDILPQNVTYPAISYSMAARESVRDIPNGPAGRARPRLTINAWSLVYDQASELSDAIRLRLDGFKGVMGASDVGAIRLDNMFDVFEDEVQAYRILNDYIISHVEA